METDTEIYYTPLYSQIRMVMTMIIKYRNEVVVSQAGEPGEAGGPDDLHLPAPDQFQAVLEKRKCYTIETRNLNDVAGKTRLYVYVWDDAPSFSNKNIFKPSNVGNVLEYSTVMIISRRERSHIVPGVTCGVTISPDESAIYFRVVSPDIFLKETPLGPGVARHTIISKYDTRDPQYITSPAEMLEILDKDPIVIWIGAQAGDIIKLEANHLILGRTTEYRKVVVAVPHVRSAEALMRAAHAHQRKMVQSSHVSITSDPIPGMTIDYTGPESKVKNMSVSAHDMPAFDTPDAEDEEESESDDDEDEEEDDEEIVGGDDESDIVTNSSEDENSDDLSPVITDEQDDSEDDSDGLEDDDE